MPAAAIGQAAAAARRAWSARRSRPRRDRTGRFRCRSRPGTASGDGAVDLDDPVRVEPAAMEVAVNVGRVDEPAARHPLDPAAEDREALVRLGPAVEAHPETVEAPGQLGVLAEPSRDWPRRRSGGRVAHGRIGPARSPAGRGSRAGRCRRPSRRRPRSGSRRPRRSPPRHGRGRIRCSSMIELFRVVVPRYRCAPFTPATPCGSWPPPRGRSASGSSPGRHR